RSTDGNSKLGEAFVYWRRPLGGNFNVQAGRIDFDDAREFLYDQNLDAVRLSWDRPSWRAEWSYSETLSDGSPVDESASNHIIYFSNRDDERHLAAYLIQRDFDLPVDTRRTHIGLRVLGEWLPEQESWLELTYMDGKTAGVNTRGLAWDVGTSWQFHDLWSITLGHAWAQGNRPGGREDTTFRQSGLQDNNAKFLGVTSFRYYGELVDPELANLAIITAGIGFHPHNKLSLDLVWHQFRQDQLSTRLADSDLDKRPNGIYRDLGEELDLVFGWRTDHDLDIEIVAARFRPGAAFGRADSAYLGKVQLRYRF
ncbi:MAG: alginate export family protein, partial [Xanthomonadales bacterium]|nr:alginate export family protein [Xanthomonadales bacterium]